MSDDDLGILRADTLKFTRDQDGRVFLHRHANTIAVGSVMSAFPLTSPIKMVSIRDEEGTEIGLIDDVRRLDPDSQRIIREELERSYFMPRITDVLDVREELNVVIWEVETNRGPRKFEVRHVRQNIRRMGRRRLVIKDVDGNRYEIRDWIKLPPLAQKLIQNYL